MLCYTWGTFKERIGKNYETNCIMRCVRALGGKYWLYENYHSTDLDGNPDGYGPLPNNQTSGEEVSEQDPAAN